MLISSIIRFCFPSVHVLYACFQVSLPFNIGMLFLWETCSMVSFLKPYVNFQNHQDSDTESVDSISRDGLDSESVSFLLLSVIHQCHFTWFAHSCSMSKLANTTIVDNYY